MRIISAIAFLLFFDSCSQSVTTPDNAIFIKYKINGIAVEASGDVTPALLGVQADKQRAWVYNDTLPISAKYVIVGNTAHQRQVFMTIETDSLKVQTYTATPMAYSFILYDTAQYLNIRPDDILKINITRHSRGTIDGTFSGKLTDPQEINNVLTYFDGNVTEGEFKNVKVVYH